jgi:hypothetical protein
MESSVQMTSFALPGCNDFDLLSGRWLELDFASDSSRRKDFDLGVEISSSRKYFFVII